MTDKQEVDVTKCIHFDKSDIPNGCKSYWDGECNHDCYYKQLKRKEQECGELKRVKDDFFKHAEISHEAVLNKNKIIDEQEKQLDQLKVENEELKEKVKELRQGWINCDKERNLQEANAEFRQRVINRYKQTLTEIKEIVEKVYNDCDNCYRDTDTNCDIDCIDCTLGGKAQLAEQILQKISEVVE